MTDYSQINASTRNINLLERVLIGEIVSNIFAPLSYLLILLIIIDGAVPQLEMLISGGRIVVPTLVLKAGLISLVAFSAIFGRHFSADLIPNWTWILFAIYLVCDIPHLLAQSLGLTTVLGGYYGYYSLILILPFVGALSSRLRTTEIVRGLYVSFWLCSVMGIAQHVFNSPILYTKSLDGSFEVISWTLFGTELVRSFSFFVYSVNFGLFCTFVGAIGLFSFLQERKQWGGLLIYAVAGVCVYFTLTRVDYLIFFVATLSVLALRFGETTRPVQFCSVFGLLTGGLLAYGGTAFLAGGEGIADNLSLLQRFAQFAYYWSVFRGGDIWQKLFGLGYVQDSRVNGQETYPIDNLYMALLLHIGVVGLLLLLALFWGLFGKISAAAKTSCSPLAAGICAIWSSFFAISLFDISLAFFPTSMMLMIIGSTCHPDAVQPSLEVK